MTLNSQHLRHFVAEHHIEAEIIHLDVDTPTVADAAAAVGVTPAQIIKSVLFLADGQPVLAIANGLARIDWKRLADHLGVSRRRLKTADATQVEAITGYVVGSVPPFGHRQRLHTVLEAGVLAQEEVYGGGGEIHALMRLATAELRRVTSAEIASLVDG